MADTVQVDHDQMNGISQRLADQAEQVRAVYQKIKQQLDVLDDGAAWVGPNATKCFDIFNNTLLPACQRLHQALDQGSNTTKQVAKMMRDADEETKGLFPS
jgi:WXG100 family type VII secretion target